MQIPISISISHMALEKIDKAAAIKQITRSKFVEYYLNDVANEIIKDQKCQNQE